MKIPSFFAAAAGVGLCLTLFADRGVSQNCANTSVGFLPLTDLGSASYLGKQGGLYPGGSNTRPPAHELAGIAAARAIRPLDSHGAPDDGQGRIVFLSIGMSNTTQEFSTFKPMADADLAKNRRLVIVDGAVGGMTASVISDLTNPNGQKYWETVNTRLSSAGVVPDQVQIAWLKEANAQPKEPFPAEELKLKNELAAVARILKTRFRNIRIAYCSSRIYGGYASTALNPEPFAYQSGFAVKWLIEDQLNGTADLNFDPEAGPVRAPWLSWGPYLWADGLTPRSDGLIYRCSDLNPSDGTHPAPGGAREKVARLLLDFLKSDSTAKIWFLRDEKIASSLAFLALVGRDGNIAAPANRVFSGLAVANLDTVEASLTCTAYDKTGNPISGSGIQNPASLALAAGTQLPRLDFQVFGEEIAARDRVGWFRIDSTASKVSAFYLIFDDALSVLDGANAPLVGTGSFVLPDISDPQGFSQIQIANPGSDAAESRFELIDSAGRPRASAATRTIPGNGVLTESLSDLFPIDAGRADYLRVSMDQKVVALLLWGKGGQYIKALEGQDVENGATLLYSPQYAVGGTWRTTLSIVNLDDQSGQVVMEFTDSTGNSIARTQRIDARGKISIDTQDFFVNPNAGLREGYVKITSSGIKLAGNVVFGDVLQQNYASALPLVSQLQDEVVYSQYASNATYYTGIAVLNPNNTKASVTVEVYDSEGRRLATDTEPLDAKRSKSFALSTLPELNGLDLISGYIRVRADQPIATFALYGTNNNTALSAIPPQRIR